MTHATVANIGLFQLDHPLFEMLGRCFNGIAFKLRLKKLYIFINTREVVSGGIIFIDREL